MVCRVIAAIIKYALIIINRMFRSNEYSNFEPRPLLLLQSRLECFVNLCVFLESIFLYLLPRKIECLLCDTELCIHLFNDEQKFKRNLSHIMFAKCRILPLEKGFQINHYNKNLADALHVYVGWCVHSKNRMEQIQWRMNNRWFIFVCFCFYLLPCITVWFNDSFANNRNFIRHAFTMQTYSYAHASII